MGDYYQNMYVLNTEHIAVLEEKVINIAQELSTSYLINDRLEISISISEDKFNALEKRYDDRKKLETKKIIKSTVVVGLISLSLGILIGMGAL